MRCRTCARPARHWDWWHPARTLRVHWTVPTCSRTCMAIWKERRVVEPNEHEAAAMRRARDLAGRHIDALGRTDVASWSVQEWRGFVEAVCGAYVDALVERQIALNTGPGGTQGAAE